MKRVRGALSGAEEAAVAGVPTETELRMDFAHSSGILFIQHLQNNYRQYHNVLHFMSTVGEPL